MRNGYWITVDELWLVVKQIPFFQKILQVTTIGFQIRINLLVIECVFIYLSKVNSDLLNKYKYIHMHTKNDIEAFLAPKKMVLVGMSRDPKKFSRVAYKELLSKGFEVYPLSPNLDEVDGARCYRDYSELPKGITHALIMTPKDKTAGSLESAVNYGITHAWLQQGAETSEALDVAQKLNLNLISKTCILMHAGHVKGVHGIHRVIMKIFGQLYK